MRKINILPLFFLTAVIALGCTAEISGSSEKKFQTSPVQSEESNGYDAYFCRDVDCGEIMEKYVGLAEQSVDCAFYDLDLKNLIDVLGAKSKAIPVRVVLEKDNYDGKIKGENVRVFHGSGLMHNKFCIIDNSLIITGSFNPVKSENEFNDNNMIAIQSSILSSNYMQEFEELWNGTLGKGEKTKNTEIILNGIKIENYFCPDDNCEDKVVEELLSAKKSIYFMTFSFTSGKIADAILSSNTTDARGVFEKVGASTQYSQYSRLKNFGLNVRLDSNPRTMHHKVFIIDNSTVITGSFNPTQNANTRNDENILIIHDSSIAAKYLKEFDRVFG